MIRDVLGARRSATLVADEAVTCYELQRGDFEQGIASCVVVNRRWTYPSNLKIINTLAVPIGVQTPHRLTLSTLTLPSSLDPLLRMSVLLRESTLVSHWLTTPCEVPL